MCPSAILKVAGRQFLEQDFRKQVVDIPFVVAEHRACLQNLKDSFVGSLRQTITSRAVRHCLLHSVLEAKCQFVPSWGVEQVSSIRDELLRTSFELKHFALCPSEMA